MTDKSHSENRVCCLKIAHRGLYYKKGIINDENSQNCPIKVIFFAAWCF